MRETAVKVIEEGISVPDDIETGVRLGMNRPFGPISVAQGLTNAESKTASSVLSPFIISTSFITTGSFGS